MIIGSLAIVTRPLIAGSSIELGVYMTKTCINFFSVQWRFRGPEVHGMCTYVKVRTTYVLYSHRADKKLQALAKTDISGYIHTYLR